MSKMKNRRDFIRFLAGGLVGGFAAALHRDSQKPRIQNRSYWTKSLTLDGSDDYVKVAPAEIDTWHHFCICCTVKRNGALASAPVFYMDGKKVRSTCLR